MSFSLALMLLVVVLPGLWLVSELRLFERSWLRWMMFSGLLIAAVASFPRQGAEQLHIERFSLLLAGAVALVLLARHFRIPWADRRPRFLLALCLLAALSFLGYYNFFAFHGQGYYVQFHDVAHYYLGSKYYEELGYDNIYTAVVRAEGELSQNRFKSPIARDLDSGEEVPIEALLRRSEEVKQRFSSERWNDFLVDVEYFRQRLSEGAWQTLLLDHGFNPTPAWVLFARSLSTRAPPGSKTGIYLLSLVDVFLLAGLFAAVFWAFGLESLLLTLCHFFLIFGAGFDWVGGAFLRYGWLFAVVLAVCCLKKQRYLGAGAFLAVAAGLRIFPIFLVLPLVFKAADAAWRHRSVDRRYKLFFSSLAATGLLLFLLTGLLPKGLGHWSDFRHNIAKHSETLSINTVGLKDVVAYEADPGFMDSSQISARQSRRQRLHRIQLALLILPLLFLIYRGSRGASDDEAPVLALPLIFVVLSLSSYYYAFLILLVLFLRGSPRLLAAVFAVEAASYCLLLFEEPGLDVFFHRSVLVGLLFLGIYLPKISPTGTLGEGEEKGPGGGDSPPPSRRALSGSDRPPSKPSKKGKRKQKRRR